MSSMPAACGALEALAAWAAALPLTEWRLIAGIAAALVLGVVLITKLLQQRVPSITVEPITSEQGVGGACSRALGTGGRK